MNYESYHKRLFVDPEPEPRFAFRGLYGVALYFEAYEKAGASGIGELFTKSEMTKS